METADPRDIGLNPDRLASAAAHVRAGLDEGAYSAATLAVARRGALAYTASFGSLGEETDVAPDTIFDLASLTKPVVAASTLGLVEDGRLGLSQTVADFLPEAKGTALGNIAVRHLATHTSGLPAWRSFWKAGQRKGALMAEILRAQPEASPGARYVYSDIGYIILGLVVAKAAGVPLNEHVCARILKPLGMCDTGYLPDEGLRARIAPTANCGQRQGKTLIGEVHDANAFALGGVAGHAGLFGTATDLATFGSAVLGDGPAVLGRPTLRLLQRSQIAPDVGGHSIGWFTSPNGMLPAGDILGDTAFGHTGFTGTMIVCDPVWALTIVLLTNRVVNPTDNGIVRRVRARVVNAVASAIVR